MMEVQSQGGGSGGTEGGAEAGQPANRATPLTGSAGTPVPAAPPAPPAAPAAPDEEMLRQALHAFKKRHKVTKLDQESKLGAHKPMTGGKRFESLGIVPPNGYPREVWRELARQGKIKDLGGGFYSL